MSYEQRDNSGSLFKNTRKESEKHPDYTGQIMVDGRTYWLSAWLKTDRNGGKFMSLAVKPKEDRRAAPPKPQQASQSRGARPSSAEMAGDDMNDEIPF